MSLARPRIPLRAAALAGAAALLLVAGCGSDSKGSGASASSGDGTNYIPGTGQITKVTAGERQAAPNISGKTLDGNPVELKDYRGKIVVLNVWGSWCPPCRAEAPHFAKVAGETEKDGVQFLGINTRDPNVAAAQAFERNFKISYPSIYDRDGKLMLKFRGNLSPQTIPSTLFIDRKGRIAVRALAELDAADLRSALKPLIAEKA